MRPFARAVTVSAVALGAGALAREGWGRRSSARRRWLEPRGREVEAGLAVRVLGEGPPGVVLLHGLAASSRFWGGAYDELACHGRLLVPDLLGFGRSPHPTDGYTAAGHADAVVDCIKRFGDVPQGVVIGAHSTGCNVALEVARQHPGLVRAVVAFGPPVYRDRDDAMRHVRRLGGMAAAFTLDNALARGMCEWVCAHRRAAGRVARLLRSDLPPPVARDGVTHTWPAYSQTLEHLVIGYDAPGALRALCAPVTLIAGVDDPVPDSALARELARELPGVAFEERDRGGHELPITDPSVCAARIDRAARTAPVSAGRGACVHTDRG